MTKVAVVSGSNKGIGFAIVRGLCKKFDGDVILTARSVERGKAAVEELKKEGLSPKFHQLDIDDKASVERLRDYLKKEYGGLDVLFNNAAIAFTDSDPTPFGEQAEVSMKTNFFNLLVVCDVLFPILRPGARVGHMSSFTAQWALDGCSPARKAEVKAATKREQIEQLMCNFVRDAKDGKHKERGWGNSAYATTKLGVTAITPIQQAMLDADPRDDIIVNCCDPGWVKTDMSGHQGKLTVDQGAANPIYASLLPPNASSPKGAFLKGDQKVVDWKVDVKAWGCM